jgi:hypothetical protein
MTLRLQIDPAGQVQRVLVAGQGQHEGRSRSWLRAIS